MNTKVWKYWRIGRDAVEHRSAATAMAKKANANFKFHTTTMGQYVFRRLPIANGD